MPGTEGASVEAVGTVGPPPDEESTDDEPCDDEGE